MNKREREKLKERKKRRKCDAIKSTSISDYFRPTFPWSTREAVPVQKNTKLSKSNI